MMLCHQITDLSSPRLDYPLCLRVNVKFLHCQSTESNIFQFLWFIESMYTRKNDTICFCIIIQYELQKFLTLLNCSNSLTFTTRESDLLSVSKSANSSNNGSISTAFAFLPLLLYFLLSQLLFL